ncbi:MAG: DUF542 domain-containing protein [Planctomycetes bacterium]|nr:DUF542 domain-containing protein [Planctomycetota bacterium]
MDPLHPEQPCATTHSIDIHDTVADIVRLHPETMRIFAKYRIDLCCGGRHPLALVATKHQLPLEALLTEIDEALAARTSFDFPTVSPR